MLVQTSPQPLTAGVVGAGLAGLSAAIALRRAGFEVQVYERSQFKNEIGAAITIPPNGTNILRQWGFDFEAARPVPNVCTRYIAADSLETMSESNYPDFGAEMQAPCLSFHRVDLHNGLRALATGGSESGHDPNNEDDAESSRGMKGTPAVIRLGCEVQAVDCERGILTLAGGSRVQKDLIIIADGAHSKLLSDFLGRPATAEPTGRSIYRWLAPRDSLTSRPELVKAYEETLSGRLDGYIGLLDLKKDVFWVVYSCSGGRLVNNAIVHNTEEHISSRPSSNDKNESWHMRATKEAVLETCSNFHPYLRQLVSVASEDDIAVHRLFKRPPLESFVNGRTAILGDAAHVMMPTHAAGAAIAIESAGVLFKVLEGRMNGAAGWDDRERDRIIRERLELFDKLRIPRCNLTMLLSNAGPEGLRVPGLEDEIRRFYKGPLPPKNAPPWSPESREILFNYDALEEAARALADDKERKKQVEAES